MKKSGFIVLAGTAAAAALMFLSACTPAQIAKGETQVQLACNVDGVAQPIAASTISVLVPPASAAVAFDNGVIHPAVVAFCASQGGVAKALAVPAAPVAPLVPAVPAPK